MHWKIVAGALFIAAHLIASAVMAGRSTLVDQDRLPVTLYVDDGGDVVRTVQRLVSAADFGDRWPFAVADATLICVPDTGGIGKFYIVDGIAFAATGAARALAKRARLTVKIGTRARVPKMFTVDDADADRLWKEAPRPSGLASDESWMRVDIRPIISAIDALSCD